MGAYRELLAQAKKANHTAIQKLQAILRKNTDSIMWF